MSKNWVRLVTVLLPLLAVLSYHFEKEVKEAYFDFSNSIHLQWENYSSSHKQLPTVLKPEIDESPLMIVEDTWSLNLFKTHAKRKGFQLLEINNKTPPKSIPDFRVLWLKVYPFQRPDLKQLILQVTQRAKIGSKILVNHFPGNGYFTSKLYMLGWAPEWYFPKGYFLGSQWDAFVTKFKEEEESLKNVPKDKFYANMPQWVMKGEHRDIEFIHSIEQVEAATKERGKKYFMAQRFINNPLLVDNKKFDIGIYVLWTSVDPVKVFLFDEILLRFCPEEYGLERTSQYVIAEKYTYPWDMPSLKDSYEEKPYSQKHALSNWLTALNRPECAYETLWDGINMIIRDVFDKSSKYMSEQTNNFIVNNQIDAINFFEMVRFDFLVDDDCKVFMLEANMSPNLHPGNLRQKSLFDNVIHKVLKKVNEEFDLNNELKFEDAHKGDFEDFGEFVPLQ